MSARNVKFNSETMPLWNDVRNLIKDIRVTNISTAERDEIAYLKKVTAYLTEMWDSIDPDFVPVSVLGNAHTYIKNLHTNLTEYNKSKNVAYLQQANNSELDALLHDIVPFIFYKGKASKALQNALTEYSETITKHSASYAEQSQIAAQQAKEYQNEIAEILEDLTEKQKQFNEYSNKLFEEDNGIESQITELVLEFEQKFKQLNQLYSQIFEESGGLKDRLDTHYDDIETQAVAIQNLRKNSSNILDELREYYNVIYGVENDDGEREGGLKDEIDARQTQLDEFKQAQEVRYAELVKQIENLLPAATSAGLASAYKEMKDACTSDIKTYGKIFYGALAALFVIVLSIQLLSFSVDTNSHNINGHLAMQLSDVSISTNINNSNGIGENLIALLRMFAFKLPFMLPAFWLAIFSATRRREAQRLEQEYAHKEALAKSYDSYRQQIENLGKEGDKLLPILLDNMIKAIAVNPSETLDKNHKDETPVDIVSKLEELIKKEPFQTVFNRASKKEN